MKEKLQVLTIKLPSEVKGKVPCKLCGKIMKDDMGFIVLNERGKVINGMCIICNQELPVGFKG